MLDVKLKIKEKEEDVNRGVKGGIKVKECLNSISICFRAVMTHFNISLYMKQPWTLNHNHR